MRYLVLQLVMLAALLAAAATGAGPGLLPGEGTGGAPGVTTGGAPGAALVTWRAAALGAGTVAIVGAVLLALWAFVSLGRSLAAVPAPRLDGRFVARGPYRWMRHPMYTSLLLLGLGVLLRRPTLLTLLAWVGLAVALALKVRREEALLLARYPEYAAYRARTWGLLAAPFPRPRR